MGGKSCVLDVRAKLPNGDYVNVEVQLKNNHNIDRRSLFYFSKQYSSRLKSGKDYVQLPNIIAINIVDFNFPETKNFHSCFHLREDTEREIMLTDALEIHFINMVKYRKQRKTHAFDDPLSRWLAWFDKKSPSKLREEVIEMDAAIRTAEERFKEVIMDEEEFDAYIRYSMAEFDRFSALDAIDKKWGKVLIDKDAEIADKDAELADKNAELIDKDAEIAAKEAENARLRAELEALKSKR